MKKTSPEGKSGPTESQPAKIIAMPLGQIAPEYAALHGGTEKLEGLDERIGGPYSPDCYPCLQLASCAAGMIFAGPLFSLS